MSAPVRCVIECQVVAAFRLLRFGFGCLRKQNPFHGGVIVTYSSAKVTQRIVGVSGKDDRVIVGHFFNRRGEARVRIGACAVRLAVPAVADRGGVAAAASLA